MEKQTARGCFTQGTETSSTMWQTSRRWTAKASPAVIALIASWVLHGQDVKTRHMPGTDFSKYRTYSWVMIPGATYPDQIIDSDIKRSIDSELVAKGLTRVESASDSERAAGIAQPSAPPSIPGPLQPPGLANTSAVPQLPELRPAGNSSHTASAAPGADLLITYHVAINRETQWNGFASGFDPWGGPGMGTASGTLTSSTIEVGTLVLQMYDSATKQLVWSGSATKTISLSKSQEKNHNNLQKAMAKLLKDYPPGRS